MFRIRYIHDFPAKRSAIIYSKKLTPSHHRVHKFTATENNMKVRTFADYNLLTRLHHQLTLATVRPRMDWYFRKFVDSSRKFSWKICFFFRNLQRNNVSKVTYLSHPPDRKYIWSVSSSSTKARQLTVLVCPINTCLQINPATLFVTESSMFGLLFSRVANGKKHYVVL